MGWMKLNKKALLAMIGVLSGFGILIYDSIQLLKGGSYTIFGLITLFMVLAVASESYEFIKERLNR